MEHIYFQQSFLIESLRRQYDIFTTNSLTSTFTATMTTDDDRRQSLRIPCHDIWLQIKIGDQTGTASLEQLSSTLAKVVNISDSGICLISTKSVALGQIVYFSDPNLPPHGTVVWTCQLKHECKVGIQFPSDCA
jgi:hypothetical protein